MADEAVQETQTETPVTPAPAPADAPDNTPEPGDAVQATEPEAPADESDTDKPAKTYDESYVKKLREEAAATRVKAKDAEKAAQEAAQQAADAVTAQKDLTEKLGRALGLIQDDTPPDPAELLKAAQEREAQIAADRDTVAERLRSYERRDALTRAATSVDGDLEAILDSRKVNEAIAKLDTSADDFASQVEQIVSAAVESNPKLKKTTAQVAAPRSGGDMSGGNANPNPPGEKDIDFYRREFRKNRGLAD